MKLSDEFIADQDNDSSEPNNCAAAAYAGAGSGWWFASCGDINLNGLNYGFDKETNNAMHYYWFTNSRESLKSASMAIMRADIS